MPTKTKSKRELIEPHAGDKRYVRRKADGTFGKTVDVGRSLAADKRNEAKTTVRKVRATAATQNCNLLDNFAIAELLIRQTETASGYRKLAFRRAARAAFMWPESW